MMYLLFNNKGELIEKQINEVIIQGSNNVNQIGVVIQGINVSSYTLTAICKLPNGENVTVSPISTQEEILPGVNGIVFSLSDAVTALAGTLRINIQAISLLTDKVIASYTVYLCVNEGVDPGDIVMMTVQQYENLINYRGLVYTAGNGISISDYAISVDSEVLSKINTLETNYNNIVPEGASSSNKLVTQSELETVKRNHYIPVNTTLYPTLADFLLSTGEEGNLYLYPIDTTDLTKGYYQYIYEGNVWIPFGTTQLDLSNYALKSDLEYITTAPVSNNTTGMIKIVVLSSEPATKYDGYIYIITGTNA